MKDKPTECYCCGFEGIKLTKYPSRNPPSGDGEPNWFCDVCAESGLSNCVNYPNQYHDTRMMKSLGYVANMIIKRMSK